MTDRDPPTPRERLEYLRPLCQWTAPESALTAKERAYRAEYDALVERLDGYNPHDV